MSALIRSTSTVFRYSARVLCSKPCLRRTNISLCNYDAARIMGAGIRLLTTIPNQRQQNNVRLQGESSQGKLDRLLFKVDADARRTGRVRLMDVEEIFNEIQVLGGSPSTTQSLMLIRCCGAFISSELPEVRTKLVTTIWKSLAQSGAVFDISHYNALLRVHLENDHKFVPLEILAELQNKNIEPNRVTYQRLIARYCQDGDIEGASNILEHMKQHKIPINENVFNSMITGHSKNNDMKEARGILDIMRNVHLEPNSDTYAVLMSGYATKGNMQAIRETLKEVAKDHVYLTDKNYMDIIYSLATNGYAQHVEEVLGMCNKQAGYNHEAINTVLQLVNLGLEDVAYMIVKSMTPALNADGTSAPAGHFFIKQLVRADRPFEKIVAFCEDLRTQNMNQVGLKKALEVALVHKKGETALKLIKQLKEHNEPLRSHYFWPIFVQLRTQKDPERVYGVIKEMQELAVPVNFETLRDWVFPLLDFNDPDIIVQRFQDLGLTVGSVVSPMIHYLVEKGDLAAAGRLADKYVLRVTPINLITPLANAVIKTNDVNSLTSILALLNETHPERKQDRPKRDWVGIFLLNYIKEASINSGEEVAKLELVLMAIQKKGLAISSSSVDLINSKLGQNVNENITALLESISTLSLELPDESRTTPKGMTVEDLEKRVIQLKSKGMNTHGALRQLFMQHARVRNYERAMEIKSELDQTGFKYTAGMHAMLMDLHTSKGDLEGALKFFSLLQTEDPDLKVDDRKIINLATLMVREGKVQDAMELIQKHNAKPGENRQQPDSLSGNVWRLLNAAVERKEVDSVRQLFDLVIKCGYAETTPSIVGTLVKVHLLRDDMDSALKEFENCCKTYRVSPWKSDIMNKLIIAEDNDRLQKVLDLSIDIHAEATVLLELIVAFAECGKIKPALKILQTPGLRIYPQRVYAVCERFLLLNKVTELENVINVLKRVPDINKDDLYYQLLRAYCKENNTSKALDLWTTLQEEDVQPSDRTLVYLADFLKKNNIEVPFAVPIVAKSTTDSFSKAVATQDVEAALDIKIKLDADNKSLDQVKYSQLIELLLQKDNLTDAINVTKDMLAKGIYPINRVLNFLMNKLSLAGDVDMIDYIGRVVPEDKNDFRFNSKRVIALVNSGRTNEALEILERKPGGQMNTFPEEGMMTLLDKHPELEDRVQSVCEEQLAAGKSGPCNMLWIHHLRQCNYSAAEKVFNKGLINTSFLKFNVVIKTAQDTNNEELARNLIGFLNRCTSIRPKAKGLAYSCLIDVLRKNKKLDEASNVLEKALSEGLRLEDFTVKEIKSLHTDLQAAGKPVPFTLPQQNLSRAQESESGSSSDDEVQAKKA